MNAPMLAAALGDAHTELVLRAVVPRKMLCRKDARKIPAAAFHIVIVTVRIIVHEKVGPIKV